MVAVLIIFLLLCSCAHVDNLPYGHYDLKVTIIVSDVKAIREACHGKDACAYPGGIIFMCPWTDNYTDILGHEMWHVLEFKTGKRFIED